MKYIRMKDNRIYQVYDKVFEHKSDKRCQLVDSRFEINLNDIDKKADTIEELCDEFVYDYVSFGTVDSKTYHAFCSYNYNLKRWENVDLLFPLTPEQVKTIKGAIWTDKGLIYVAEMNEEGKLELL